MQGKACLYSLPGYASNRLWIWISIFPTKLVATATSLEGSKNNLRSFIYCQSSTNAANFVTIGLVDVEIIGLTEISKIY